MKNFGFLETPHILWDTFLLFDQFLFKIKQCEIPKTFWYLMIINIDSNISILSLFISDSIDNFHAVEKRTKYVEFKNNFHEFHISWNFSKSQIMWKWQWWNILINWQIQNFVKIQKRGWNLYNTHTKVEDCYHRNLTPRPWLLWISLVCFSFVRIIKTFPKSLVLAYFSSFGRVLCDRSSGDHLPFLAGSC